jgi:hypothetical protein
MSKRGVGLLLILTLIIGLGTLAQDYRFDTLIATERGASLSLDRDFGVWAESLAGLRAAQAAYVAAGQAPETWAAKVAATMNDLAGAIDQHRAATISADARDHYDAAIAALQDLKALDGRARASATQGDRLYASDLIFMDAAAAVEKIRTALASARSAEEQAREAHLSQLGQWRMAMNGVALLFALAVALYFGRAATLVGAKPAPTMAQMLKELPPPVTNSASAPKPVLATPAPPVRTLNLASAAELCGELARVADGRELATLIERTAAVLDAKGVVLWAADSDGALLRPKLGPMQIDSDNPTALAFRSLQPQLVHGAAPGEPGAIAVPLVMSSGCVGVLSAETRHSHPGADVLPVAKIIAAQFSALIAPTDTALPKAARG